MKTGEKIEGELKISIMERNKKTIAEEIRSVLNVLNGLINEAKRNSLVVKIHNREEALGYIGDPIEIELYEKITY